MWMRTKEQESKAYELMKYVQSAAALGDSSGDDLDMNPVWHEWSHRTYLHRLMIW